MLRRLFAGKPPSLPPRTSSGERIYAIGDIHGHLAALDDLLARIADDDAARSGPRGRLVFLGDLVDRGDRSAQVVERVMALRSSHDPVVLCGNHEELLLSSAEGNRDALRLFCRAGGRETLLSYGVDDAVFEQSTIDDVHRLICDHVPQTHLKFLRSAVDFHVSGDYWFVHAGVRRGVPLHEQRHVDLRWIRREFLDVKTAFDGMVVHGHTITEEVDFRPNRIGIDTGAYRTGRLTCLGLQDDEQWVLQTAL